MKGNLVYFAPLEEEDFELIAKCVQPSMTSALGRGRQEFVTVDVIKNDILNGNTGYATCKTIKDDKKIGFVSWRPLTYEGNYELGGVILEPELWDMGYGAEGSLLALDYLFHFKNAHRVQFVTGLFNYRTVKMLMKTELTIEGILRDYYYLDGEYHDAIVWSILRDEFYSLKDYKPVDAIPREKKLQIKKEFREYLEKHWNGKIKQNFIK